MTVDLTKSFDIHDFGIASQTKKAVDVPVLNRFGIWADSNQDSIYIQGGHFYTAPGWDESQYHIDDSAIPTYSIWKFDLSSYKWTDVTKLGNKKDVFRRALAGAGVSVPSLNQSFYAGFVLLPKVYLTDGEMNILTCEQRNCVFTLGPDRSTRSFCPTGGHVSL